MARGSFPKGLQPAGDHRIETMAAGEERTFSLTQQHQKSWVIILQPDQDIRIRFGGEFADANTGFILAANAIWSLVLSTNFSIYTPQATVIQMQLGVQDS